MLLDAFGWAFVQRHAQHPLLARIARDGRLEELAAQFPSTTTAHVTTMHTGLPVEAHGLYEWRIWEPAAGRVVVPLLVGPDDGYDPRGLLPEGPSFYQRLAARGAGSAVFSPARFSPSTYDGAAVRGAPIHPYDDLADGARALAATLADADRLVQGPPRRPHAGGGDDVPGDAAARLRRAQNPERPPRSSPSGA